MSKRMFFDYELVLPKNCGGSDCYGKKNKDDGSWSGVMGKKVYSMIVIKLDLIQIDLLSDFVLKIK